MRKEGNGEEKVRGRTGPWHHCGDLGHSTSALYRDSRHVPSWRSDLTHYGYNPTDRNYTRLRSKNHNHPENWRFPLRPRQAGSRGSLRVSIVCPRAAGTKTLNPFSTVHHLHSQVHSTFRHYTRGSGSCRRQRTVRVWINSASYRSLGISSRLPCNRTALGSHTRRILGRPRSCPH